MTEELHGIGLKSFVKAALSEVLQGVREARDENLANGWSEKDGLVNPAMYRESGSGMKRTYKQNFTKFEFDIALTVEDSASAKGGAAIRVAGIGIGGDGKKESSSSSISRIRFSVPVMMPTSVKAEDES